VEAVVCPRGEEMPGVNRAAGASRVVVGTPIWNGVPEKEPAFLGAGSSGLLRPSRIVPVPDRPGDKRDVTSATATIALLDGQQIYLLSISEAKNDAVGENSFRHYLHGHSCGLLIQCISHRNAHMVKFILQGILK
jgi:hypothetical protein